MNWEVLIVFLNMIYVNIENGIKSILRHHMTSADHTQNALLKLWRTIIRYSIVFCRSSVSSYPLWMVIYTTSACYINLMYHSLLVIPCTQMVLTRITTKCTYTTVITVFGILINILVFKKCSTQNRKKMEIHNMQMSSTCTIYAEFNGMDFARTRVEIYNCYGKSKPSLPPMKVHIISIKWIFNSFLQWFK